MNPLCAARRRRSLTLTDIAALTRLSPRHVQAIDEGRFDELPAGIYARGYVRAFAAAVGVESAELELVLPFLPAAPDPFPAIHELRAPRARRQGTLNLPRLCAAATIDALLLLVVNALAVAAGAAAFGLDARALIETAPLPLVLCCATTWLEYFLLFAGVHGRTAGEHVCGVPPRRHETPLRLTAILQRAAS